MSEILDCGADFGERTDGIETSAKCRGSRTAVEIPEKMDVHLHRRKRVLGRNVVAWKALGELPAELKNQISHRANALRVLREKLQERLQQD